MKRRTPPPVLESLLGRSVGSGISGQGTLGDLSEAYTRLRASRPGFLCDLWYAWQVVTLLVWGAVAGRRAVGGGGFRRGASAVAADLHWTVRLAFRRPFFTAGVALTLGLGLGTTTAVFRVVDGTFSATSWWSDPERVMALWPDRPFSRGELSFLTEEGGAAYDVVGGYKEESLAVATPDGESWSVPGVRMTPALFQQLRVQPALGRAFGPDDGVPDAEPTVILSHRFWTALGADPAALGSRLSVNGELRTVVGIQGPRGTAPGSATDAWIPLILDPRDPDFFPAYELNAVGVLRSGAAALEGQETLRAFARGMAARFSFFYPPDFGQDATVERSTERERAGLSTPLLLLLGATALLLLVAGVNVGNMVLSRALERTRELAVRRAIGATRTRVVLQLVLESGLLCALGAATGMLLAGPAARQLVALWADDAPVSRSAWTSPGVLLFGASAAALTWIVLAGVPVLHFLVVDRRGVRANVERSGRAGRVLVATQAAVATVLLASAALLVASVGSLRRIPLGFDPADVVAFRLSPSANLLADPGRLREIQSQVLTRVRGLPGVEAAGLASEAPLGGVPSRTPVNVEDRTVDVARAPRVALYGVDPGYFATLRVKLIRGRLLDESDRGGRVASVVVNRALAEALWPGEDPVGKRIAIDPHAWTSWVNVVGEVENLRSEDLVRSPGAAIYVALAEQLTRETTLLVRGGAGVPELASAVRDVVRDVDPAVPVGSVRALPRIVRGAYGTAWITMGLLTVLALLATALAALGVHAALSQDFARRRREIALRMALGGRHGRVTLRVLSAGLAAAAAGIAVGLGGALFAGELLESLLFGVSRADPRALMLAAGVVLIAALAAAAAPAFRASTLAPAEVMKEE